MHSSVFMKFLGKYVHSLRACTIICDMRALFSNVCCNVAFTSYCYNYAPISRYCLVDFGLAEKLENDAKCLSPPVVSQTVTAGKKRVRNDQENHMVSYKIFLVHVQSKKTYKV